MSFIFLTGKINDVNSTLASLNITAVIVEIESMPEPIAFKLFFGLVNRGFFFFVRTKPRKKKT